MQPSGRLGVRPEWRHGQGESAGGQLMDDEGDAVRAVDELSYRRPSEDHLALVYALSERSLPQMARHVGDHEEADHV